MSVFKELLEARIGVFIYEVFKASGLEEETL